MATIENNRELKEKLSFSYKIDINEINCFGYFSESSFKSCKNCPIRNCVRNRNIKGCYECQNFPCEIIEKFPYQQVKNIMLHSIPEIKKAGVNKWIQEEELRFKCPCCGTSSYRGEKYCRYCKTEIKL